MQVTKSLVKLISTVFIGSTLVTSEILVPVTLGQDTNGLQDYPQVASFRDKGCQQPINQWDKANVMSWDSCLNYQPSTVPDSHSFGLLFGSHDLAAHMIELFDERDCEGWSIDGGHWL